MTEREHGGLQEPQVALSPGVAAARRSVERTRRITQVVLGVLFILGIVALLYWGREALAPFLIGLIIAYMLLPPVRRLERTLPYTGFWPKARRPLSAVVVFVITLIVVSLLLRSLAEPVIEQTAQILSSLDELWQQAQANAPVVRDWYEQSVPEQGRGWVDDTFQTVGQALLSFGGNVGRWIVRFTSNALGSVFAFIAAPLFVIYFLIDEPRMTTQIRHQFPRAWAGDTLALLRIFNRVFGS